MTIGELSRRSGVSVRALRHYDAIGLLKPGAVTDAGYRQYGEEALDRLSLILLFRALETPLREIARMLDSGDFDPVAALDRRIAQLQRKRDHLEHLLLLAQGVRMKGLNRLRLTADDLAALDEVAERAVETVRTSPAMKAQQARAAAITPADEARNEADGLALLTSFREHPDDASSPEALAMARRLRDFISERYIPYDAAMTRYFADCLDGGGAVTQAVDETVGAGTAAFLARALRALVDAEAENAEV